MAAFFSLLALLQAFHPRASFARAPVTALLTLLACLSKESGAVVPGLILLGTMLLPPCRRKEILVHVLASGTAVAGYLVFRAHVLHPLAGQVWYHGGSPFSNTIYALFGLVYDTYLVLAPHFRNLDFQGGFFRSVPWSRVVGGAFLFSAAAVTLAVMAAKRPVASFSFFFFFTALLPTSSLVFPLRSLVNDRYLYLAMAGAALAVARILIFVEGKGRHPLLARGAPFLFMIVLTVLGGLSARRALEWRNGKQLWTAALKTHPGSVKARLGLATALYNDGEISRALSLAEEVIALSPPGSSLSADGHHLAAKALATETISQVKAVMEEFSPLSGATGSA